MAKVSIRYIVNDVDSAIDFDCQQLGFHEDMHPSACVRDAVARGTCASS